MGGHGGKDMLEIILLKKVQMIFLETKVDFCVANVYTLFIPFINGFVCQAGFSSIHINLL